MGQPVLTCWKAMYGSNFAYFDPNIWWNEDEMRKQVEQLNGCFVLTGSGMTMPHDFVHWLHDGSH